MDGRNNSSCLSHLVCGRASGRRLDANTWDRLEGRATRWPGSLLRAGIPNRQPRNHCFPRSLHGACHAARFGQRFTKHFMTRIAVRWQSSPVAPGLTFTLRATRFLPRAFPTAFFMPFPPHLLSHFFSWMGSVWNLHYICLTTPSFLYAPVGDTWLPTFTRERLCAGPLIWRYQQTATSRHSRCLDAGWLCLPRRPAGP